MSILIRDIRLPENCYECFCCNQTYQDKDDGNEFICTCNILMQDTTCFSSERREDCPLVEVPDTYEIKTRQLTDEERKIYLETLKKGAVQTGNRLYFADDDSCPSYILSIMDEFSKIEYKETNGLEE